MERVTSAAWAADNRTIFYTVEDATTKRSHRLYRHVVGSAEADTLIYDETDERFRLEIERDITDFVQEDGAVIRQLQPSRLLGDRAREGAALVPKEFALQ